MKMLKLAGTIPALAFAVSLGVSNDAQASSLMFDRGLPSENLNQAAGANRSNVSWASGTQGGFVGDDFSIGSAGTTYVIDSLTVWGAQFNPLSSDISDITLWLGKQGSQLSSVSTGSVTGNMNSNPNINHSFVTYADGVTSTYWSDNSQTDIPIAQTIFSGLNLTVEGGQLYDFGIAAGGPFGWFGHASNAALSGTPQDGADGLYRVFDSAGNFLNTVDSSVTGWDKSSDINVQVTAAPIPLPAAGWLLLTAVGGLGLATRRRRKAA